ncbi:MAG TPA: hypothetical protein VE221_03390 [Sphingomicrobium sp.]|nr:hypothetical protein [Sphingomicrobium sp.]
MNFSIAAVLFATIVASLIAMPAPAPVPAKAASTLLAKADRLPVQPAQPFCSQQNWPNFSAFCLHYTDHTQAIGVRAVGDQG